MNRVIMPLGFLPVPQAKVSVTTALEHRRVASLRQSLAKRAALSFFIDAGTLVPSWVMKQGSQSDRCHIPRAPEQTEESACLTNISSSNSLALFFTLKFASHNHVSSKDCPTQRDFCSVIFNTFKGTSLLAEPNRKQTWSGM